VATRVELRDERGELLQSEKDKLVHWCAETFEPAVREHPKGSYVMKASFGNTPDGFYVFEHEFIEAMKRAGFKPSSERHYTECGGTPRVTCKFKVKLRGVLRRQRRPLRPDWARVL